MTRTEVNNTLRQMAMMIPHAERCAGFLILPGQYVKRGYARVNRVTEYGPCTIHGAGEVSVKDMTDVFAAMPEYRTSIDARAIFVLCALLRKRAPEHDALEALAVGDAIAGSENSHVVSGYTVSSPIDTIRHYCTRARDIDDDCCMSASEFLVKCKTLKTGDTYASSTPCITNRLLVSIAASVHDVMVSLIITGTYGLYTAVNRLGDTFEGTVDCYLKELLYDNERVGNNGNRTTNRKGLERVEYHSKYFNACSDLERVNEIVPELKDKVSAILDSWCADARSAGLYVPCVDVNTVN